MKHLPGKGRLGTPSADLEAFGAEGSDVRLGGTIFFFCAGTGTDFFAAEGTSVKEKPHFGLGVSR